MSDDCKDLNDLTNEFEQERDTSSPLFREGEGAEFVRKFFNAYQKCRPEVSIEEAVRQLENLGFFEISGAPSLKNTVGDLERQIISTQEGKENSSKDDSKRNVEKGTDPVMDHLLSREKRKKLLRTLPLVLS